MGAKGRNLLGAESYTMLELANVVKEKYPGYQYPKTTISKWFLYLVGPMIGMSWSFIRHNVGIRAKYDNSKVKRDLNFEFRPIKQTVNDMMASAIEHNLVQKAA